MHFESKISSEEIFSGKVFRVTKDSVLLENNSVTSREIVHHRGGVCVAALDENQNLIFVRQFRYAFGEELLELPAGKIESDENPAVCGLRELEEETGFSCNKFELLATLYPTCGYSNEIIYIYLAQDLVPSSQNLDDDEFLSVEKIPLSSAFQMVLENKIPDAKSQIAILKLAALLHI